MQGSTVNEDRSYVHGIEYVGSAINFIHTDEGRARPNSSTYLPEYQITDHLGNARAIFGDESNNNTFSAANDIVQATDYYAFGRQIAYLEANPQFQYKFNGKEYSSDLNEYNYGARYFNPVTARWNAIDNDAEKSRRWSPYTYTNNNPVRNIDVDGNDYTWYANAVSLMLGTQISQGFENGMQDQWAASEEEDYEEGKSNTQPLQYDALNNGIINRMSTEVMHQTGDWMKSYGS